MKTQNKKLLAVMVVSAMMTCPVWANETTTTQSTSLTGYESADEMAAIQRGEQPARTQPVSAAAHEELAKAPAVTDTDTTAQPVTSGLTGYEPSEETAGGGRRPPTARPRRSAAPGNRPRAVGNGKR